MPEGNYKIQKSHIEHGKSSEGEEKIKDKLAEAIGKMYRLLKETGKNIREVVPQYRNFDIELRESTSGIDLRLRHKESGKEIDLSIFLLPKYFFGKDESFICRDGEKKIGFPENELQFRGFLLSLFHEIGHSHEEREHSTTPWDDLHALGSLLTKWIKFMGIAIKKELKQKGSGKEYMNIVRKLDVDSLLPHWYLDKKSKADAQSERNAWAYALRSLRKLKQEGYDVFAGFENTDQIRAYVTYCLYTYDTALLMKKLMSGDLRDLQRLKGQSGVFSKKKQNA